MRIVDRLSVSDRTIASIKASTFFLDQAEKETAQRADRQGPDMPRVIEQLILPGSTPSGMTTPRNGRPRDCASWRSDLLVK
jgi:hypothetical protein